MASVTCGDVRTYLQSVSSGGAPPAGSSGVWDDLLRHGAVGGTPVAPTITDIGRHVLKELGVRAGRTDPLPLESVAEQLGRVSSDLENVAKSASYFLSELGPVVPIDSLPLLRSVAVGLANRRETPEEIAEEFRNAWGSVEVMGGATADRLLAAEILNAESADIEHLYAPMMRTVEEIRAKDGNRSQAVSAAVLLHLAAGPRHTPALETFLAVRSQAGGDEAAALLAASGKSPQEAIAARDTWKAGLPSTLEPNDATLTATYLAAEPAATPEVLPRIAALVPLLASRYSKPGIAAALLATSAPIEASELADWLEKASKIAHSRKLAPNPAELEALALALVHGIPASEFVSAQGAPPAIEPSPASVVALHAWVFRPLISTSGGRAPAAPTPP